MLKAATDFARFAENNNVVLVTAESCTAGLIGATVASVSGSSKWLESGFIVYTAESKNNLLGVKYETIKSYNITSEQVASEMALGALSKSINANLSISVTGVAGPNGGTKEIPVGTVCIAWIYKNGDNVYIETKTKIFRGDRNKIRESVAKYVLKKAIKKITKWNEK